jgi:hypothetical protein
MRYSKALFFILAIITASFALPEKTTFQQWKLIGDKKVNFLVDRDVVHVTGNDNYTKLKIRVKDGPVKIMDMDVHFENGDKFDVALKQRIAQGGESRVIDLPGGSRSIRKIEFWYETKGFLKGRATVEVWGRR